MFGINHDPVPPKPAIDAVYALLAAITDPAIDGVYALLDVITDPAAAKQRMDELQAKIDAIDTIAVKAGQLDAREKNIADREGAADERELALDARDQVVADMKELAASADRRVEYATQAEAGLTQKQRQDAVEFARQKSALDDRLSGLIAREEKLKALEADLGIRIRAMDTREKAYADWLRTITSGPSTA